VPPDASIDSSEIQSALSSIGLSAALIFGATLLGQGLGFVTRVTMARYLPVDGYGNVTIGLAILNLFGIAALVGVPPTLSRYLPRQETAEERQYTITSGFQIVIILSVVIAIGICISSGAISKYIFGNDDLVWIIRIFASAMPFYAILRLCFGGFRGYETTYPRILTQNVLRPGLQFAGIIIFVSLGFGTIGIAIAYGSAFVVVAIVAVGLLLWLIEFSPKDILRFNSVDQYSKILSFSLPLAVSGAINIIAKQSDLIILGIFKTSAQVGIYEVSFRMAVFTYLLLIPAIGYLFQPIVSRFDANKDNAKISDIYTVVTRWIVVGSCPAFVLFFLFPEQTLGFFFGPEYMKGALALRILLIGFLISLIPGLTGSFLTSVGETQVIMYISVATVIINVLINVVLIPTFGILGAAIATASARSFNNVSQLYFIHTRYDVHPFDRKFLLPTIIMIVIFIGAMLIPLPYAQFTFLEGFIIATGISCMYLVVIFLTRSLYAVELELIDGLLTKLGFSITVSNYLEWFVR
jgi:O-antigen/teichoic acid export membrane protein